MSNIFWYPEAIKACVLTDVLNWKTIEKSYEDLCKRFGDNTLLITSHRRLFNKLIRETQKLQGARTNINEIIFNDSMYLRYRILINVIYKVPIDKSYITIRETMEDINYPEFEFWYYRFYNGQQDLGYDRSKDPKPLTFSDLPVDVIEKIIEVSELKPRYILRRVSRNFQCLVDSSMLVIKNISFNGVICPIIVSVDYVEMKFPCQSCLRNEQPVIAISYLTNDVCRHLSIFIDNPKLQLGTLVLRTYGGLKDSVLVRKLFESLAHQLHVRSLRIDMTPKEDLMSFIRCLKPRVLKKLKIGCDFSAPIDRHDIVESEQWKQAEEVIITSEIVCDLSHFFHFNSFVARLTKVTMESMLKFRDEVSKSSNFEWCRIRTFLRPNDEEIQKALGLKKQIHKNIHYFVYSIPNSTKSLFFSFCIREISMKKSTTVAGF